MYDHDTEFAILLGLVAELAADMRGAVYTLGWAGAGHPYYRPRLRIDNLVIDNLVIDNQVRSQLGCEHQVIDGNPLGPRHPDSPTVTLCIDGDALVVTFGATRLVGFVRFVFALADPEDMDRAKTIITRGFRLSSREWARRVRAGWSLDRILEIPSGGTQTVGHRVPGK